MNSQLVEAWHMSNEANLYLLAQTAEEYLADRYAGRTRSVAAQFAHIHNVRMRWLGVMSRKSPKDVASFAKGAQPSSSELREALQASAELIAEMLGQAEAEGKVSNWKGSPASFLAYLVAHEAHHRALAMVAMRIAGHKPSQEVVYGQWDWGKLRKLG